MSQDIEKELEAMSAEMTEAPETPLPSLEEQKAIVAKLKKLEQEGKLTPEVLEEHFGKFNDDEARPVH
ncbi:chromosome partitioning protein ParA [Vibrio aphrogenes]|uniref:chromosome partitioning protein ParA n=1 Tax=Vibrio aphrogenes TaxID=1891186 RepID=UPI000B34AA49|nr:chromosome partitioning protein ParA [Vibrio aphrogenes]